jgi:hypothetical protein
MEFVIDHWAEIGAGVGMIAGGFVLLAKLTKNKKDDVVAGWVVKITTLIFGARK